MAGAGSGLGRASSGLGEPTKSTVLSGSVGDGAAECRPTSLDMLRPGQSGTVVGVMSSDDTGRRLMEMGVVRGSKVKLVKLAPLGDPLELELEGYHLSLRKAEAHSILVQLA